MSDLISRQAAIEVIDAVLPVDPMKSEYAQGIACGAALAKTYIKQLPSAQPERKKGKWVELSHGILFHVYKCDQCGNTIDMNGVNAGRGGANYCPNCGADMRGKSDE